MSDITPTSGPSDKAPHPAVCPVCGLAADNAIARQSERVTVATFVCTEGHLFTITWVVDD